MRDTLSVFGYTAREAIFLRLAGPESGYLLARQFEYFLDASPGALTQAFTRRLLENRHAEVSIHTRNIHLYHLCSRPFYAAIGEENNRNRRSRPSYEVRVRLMRLDFRLHNQTLAFISSEEEKVAHFRSIGIPPEALPQRRYRSQTGSSTVRYFLDKSPIWIAPDGSISFAFISGDSASSEVFKSFLAEYKPLFSRLERFSVVYVTTLSELAERGERIFRALTLAAPSEDESLRNFFRLRALQEAGKTADLSVAELKILRSGRTRYRGEQFETLYRTWLFEQRAPKRAMLSGSFSVFLLPYHYNLFGDLPRQEYGRE